MKGDKEMGRSERSMSRRRSKRKGWNGEISKRGSNGEGETDNEKSDAAYCSTLQFTSPQ